MTATVLRLSQPAVEPISLDDAKDHLRVDISDDDDLISALITAARERVENFCNRAFVSAEFAVLYSGDLPSGDAALWVPLPDVTDTTVTYTDADGASASFTGYTFDAERQTITPDDAWPSGSNLRVGVTAGNEDSPITLPGPIRSAILLYLADLYDRRTASFVDERYYENPAAVSLMMPYRVEMGV